MSFVSPLNKQQTKKTKVVEPTELPLFKPEKLTLTKSEARKVLHHSGELSHSQIAWTQRWLVQRIRERSLPPQLAGADAFGQILRFLSPNDALALFDDVRNDFARTVGGALVSPHDEKDDLSFLEALACEAYHEHQSQPPTSSHNSPKSDDDP